MATFHFEPGADGKPQAVFPGAERATQADLAKRQAKAPLKAKAHQRPCNHGLFSDDSKQAEMFK